MPAIKLAQLGPKFDVSLKSIWEALLALICSLSLAGFNAVYLFVIGFRSIILYSSSFGFPVTSSIPYSIPSAVFPNSILNI
jgi:hypothetical protein